MIITFANQKGGVGKTTLSTSLAFECCIAGYRTLLIDADPQGSIMSWCDNRDNPFPDNLTIVAMPKKTIHRDIGNIACDYECVIIDSPPRTTDITRSAILASNLVLVPCTPSPYDVWASMGIIDIIQDAQIYNDLIKCAFVINRKIVNTAIGRDVVEALEGLTSDVAVLDAEISQRVAFAECSQGLAIQELDMVGKARKEIYDLYKEVLERYGNE